MTFHAAVRPPAGAETTAARWLLVRGNQVLLDPAGGLGVDAGTAAQLPAEDGPPHFLGTWHGQPVWCRGVPDEGAEPSGCTFSDLYSLHARVDETSWLLAGRAVQIVEWGRTHRFCGRCGSPTEWVDEDRSTRCPRCRLPFYPRLSPATITLVHRDREVLLARGKLFPLPMYSALAGFVEPGETLEQTVRREVKEEVGVDLGDVRYVASQPWPFPNSLMLGFEAEYAGGDIVLDETEILDARWFPVDDLPNIPGPISIAHRLITGYVARILGT